MKLAVLVTVVVDANDEDLVDDRMSIPILSCSFVLPPLMGNPFCVTN